MDSQKKKEKMLTPSTTRISTSTMPIKKSCTNPSCFFCIMKEPDSSIRISGIIKCFKEISLIDDQEKVLILSGLWNIAMTQPDDPEFPSLGIFDCMVSLIYKGVNDRDWLLSGQNIYIPYYAAHIIGSYTMNKPEFAEKAVQSGVIPPLLELMRGKLTWVEQRVAVRALGHLASYEETFEAVAIYEEEVVTFSTTLASTCLQTVYQMFVGVKNESERINYHCDLLTRGVGGLEMQNRKAEEWASQIQCWSLHLLNCFAVKERSIDLICREDFLKKLCEMWGGLVNHTSPAGVGLIRNLCYSKIGRASIAESNWLLENLCNLSRSSDDWQYMGIDCLLLLLKDPDTRYKVIELATSYMIDLVELRNLGGRSNLGETITRALLTDFKQRKLKTMNCKVQSALKEIWVWRVERRRREKTLCEEKVEEKRVMVSLIKQQGNNSFCLGEIEAAVEKYTEALELCPLRLRKERTVLYSNRAQCHLMLSNPDAAISDTTRALCLSNPTNSHAKSLWRRSQAYDMKGLAKESLMDCLLFVNGTKYEKIPYYAARMINKQMDLTWLFAAARLKISNDCSDVHQSQGYDQRVNEESTNDGAIRVSNDNKGLMSGLSTILEEPLIGKDGSSRRKLERVTERRKAVSALHV